jgi:hypothetical protein
VAFQLQGWLEIKIQLNKPMKVFDCLFLYLVSALMVTSCGPNSTGTDDTQSTTKTTTTVTTTTPASSPGPATLTQANLDKVQNDMSQAEVEAIFGQPSSSQSEPIPIVGGTQTTYTYQNGNSAVTIIFKNNQVKQKSGTFGP